jgi:hypothetical protein
MGILNRNNEGQGRVLGAVEAVAKVAKPLARGIKPMLEPLIGTPLDEQGIWERRARDPQVKAELGAAAVLESEKGQGDSQLHDLGVALAVKALTDLDKPAASIPPPEVPEAVTGIVESLLPGVEASDKAAALPQVAADNRYISPEVAVRASAILEETTHPPQFP